MSLAKKTAPIPLLALFLLILSGTSAGAQGSVSYDFVGTVTQVEDPSGLLNNEIELGDIYSGSFEVNTDVQPFYRVASTATFGLNGGLGNITITINGKTFEHLATANPQPDDEVFTLFQKSNRNGDESNWHDCHHEITLTSKNNRFPGNPDPAGTSIELSMEADDCSFETDPGVAFDQFSAERWPVNSQRLEILARDGGQILYRINAQITSLSDVGIEFTTIKGKVFADYNTDCRLDGNEPALQHQLITFEPTTVHAISNADGEYQMILPRGQYQATVSKHPTFLQSCPAAVAEIDASSETLNVDFPMEPTQDVEALDVSLASGRAIIRPGFPLSYIIRIRNTGLIPYTGQIRLRHDPVLLDFSSEPMADGYSAPLAAWNIVELPVGNIMTIQANFRVPPDEKLLGTIICATVEADGDFKNNDELLRQSQDEVCQEIRGAYDPNDIQVFSGTNNADGAILQDEKILTYLIRFQNEGNEDAITVRVVDKLSEFHRIDKLRLGAASHDYEFNFTDDGELEWTFNDINLPPKERDEPGSNGFVKFEVHLQSELAIGTEIPNSAAIYFDFNSPVITNTVVSRLTSPGVSVDEGREQRNSGFNIAIYPNPASDNLTVQFIEAQRVDFTLTNILGQTVMRHSRPAQEKHVLDISDILPGTYFLRIQHAGSTALRTVHIAW